MASPTPPDNTQEQGSLCAPRVFIWVKRDGVEGIPVMQTEIAVEQDPLGDDNSGPTRSTPVGAYNMLCATDNRWSRSRGERTSVDGVPIDPEFAYQGAAAMGFAFNGASFDRVRNNLELELLASAARIASIDSADSTNYNGLGAHFIIDVSAVVGAPSIVPTIQGKDPVSGNYYDILVGAAITATGTTVLKVHPGISPLASGAANDILPRTFRVSVAAANADSISYSIGANLG